MTTDFPISPASPAMSLIDYQGGGKPLVINYLEYIPLLAFLAGSGFSYTIVNRLVTVFFTP